MSRLKPQEVDDVLKSLYGHFKDQLTPWESDFVASVQAQWSRRHHLSDGQDRKLQEVWEDFASGRRRKALGAEPDE